jgi:hypothetical protein
MNLGGVLRAVDEQLSVDRQRGSGSMPFRVELDRRYMPRNAEPKRGGGSKRVGRQILELGHAQVGDGDEVAHCSEATSCRLGLLKLTVHGLHVGV